MHPELPRRLGVIGVLLVALGLLAAPASAQTGMIKGKVVDASNQPLENAHILIQIDESGTRKFETKTNKKGEFIQIGLAAGNYQITADKDGLSQGYSVRVRSGTPTEVMFQLVPGGAAGSATMTKEDAAKIEALKATVDAAAAANNAGDFDTAIAKFNEALVIRPNCPSCYSGLGFAYDKKKDYEKAEAALKKAIELKPDFADAYDQLATIYNAQRKFDLAAAASAEAAKLAGTAGGAAGGPNPDMLYNQGVILWNGGKIPEAKKIFEEVVSLNPNHADAHYQLGMANLNEGKMPEAAAEFETYLKLAPDGQFAALAKGVLGQIKK